MSRKFHVYIIESPSSIDLYHQRFEGNALMETLKLSQISSSYHQTVDLNSFKAAFYVGLAEYFTGNTLPPIIHISTHGNREGIQLTSKEDVNWTELKKLLLPVNSAVKGGLILSLSSCNGISGSRMSMSDDKFPFAAIVGNKDKPTWSETNIAYATFYHLFALGKTVEESVNAMKIASGNNNFGFIESQTARQAYLSLLRGPAASQTIQEQIPSGQQKSLSRLVTLPKIEVRK